MSLAELAWDPGEFMLSLLSLDEAPILKRFRSLNLGYAVLTESRFAAFSEAR